MKKKKKKKIVLYFMIGLVVLLLAVAVFQGVLTRHDPNLANLSVAQLAPCKEYIFGTDHMGRCMFCRLMEGMLPTLTSAFIVIAIVFVTGTLIGITAAYYGGVVDAILMRINVIFQAFPSFILAMCIAGILGSGRTSGIVALCLVSWTHYARLARSLAVTLIDSDYIKSAKISGANGMYIIVFHILPNIFASLLVTAALDVSGVILSMAGLSFMGLGAQRPSCEWGLMINDNRQYLQIAPWTVLFPGMALFVVIMVFNLFADNLRDYLDAKRD